MDAVTTHFEKTVLLLNTAGFLEIGEYAKKFSAVLFMGLPARMQAQWPMYSPAAYSPPAT